MSLVINIEIQIDDSFFLLKGNVAELIKKRRAKIFLVDYLNAILSDDEILIPYEEETKEITLQFVRDLLVKFGFTENPSDEVQQQLSEYYQNQRNFKAFSKQAYQIRNDRLTAENLNDFKNFSDVLTLEMSSRTLYPLQLLASYHLTFSQNACNFSVPGSGKTSIVYGAYAYLRNLNKDNPKKVEKMIVIGPLSSFGPWEDEFYECFGKQPKSKRLSGGVRKEDRVRHFYSSSPDEITLISYNGVPNMLDDLIYFLKKYKCMVILDEAHKIKNTEGGVHATAVLQLANFARSRVILTGTPVPNGYEDLFNLFEFIWPSHDVIGFRPYQLKDMSENINDKRIGKLVKNIKPYFIRIRKSDLSLPEPINHPPIVIEMDELQTEIYEYIEKNYMDYFISQSSGSDLHSLLTRARLIRLMQVSTNPSLLKKSLDEYFIDLGYTNNTFVDDAEIIQKISNYSKLKVPKKFIYAGNLIKDLIANNEKVIVWATFIQNLHDFSDFLTSIDIETRLLYGATPIETDSDDENIETRESIIKEFHNESCSYKVLIANPFAISESISLHKACHHAIYLERTFNAANFIQSKDRIHRYGLTDHIHYYYILSDNNIDMTIHQRLIEKEQRMLSIIENEPIPLFNRDFDDEQDDLSILIKNYVKRSPAT